MHVHVCVCVCADPMAVHGSCGLYNLGNTCFMNSGIQSLASCPPLLKYFFEEFQLSDNLRGTLTGAFYLLLCKIWSGTYSLIHPRHFKELLGLYHPQFQDYRQVRALQWAWAFHSLMFTLTGQGPSVGMGFSFSHVYTYRSGLFSGHGLFILSCLHLQVRALQWAWAFHSLMFTITGQGSSVGMGFSFSHVYTYRSGPFSGHGLFILSGSGHVLSILSG